MMLASTPGISRPATAAVLGLLCVALYLPPAANTPFFTRGEPREALVVRHIVEEGNWILPERPSADGSAMASKPPFFHWLGALVARAIGRTSELATRSPSLVLATAAVFSVWICGATLLSERAALAAAIVLATNFEWVRAASSARVDATLAALMTVALLLFYKGFVRGRLTAWEALAAYFCLAAATLTKGPVGFVLPLAVLVTALLAQGRARLIGRFRPVLGTAVLLAVVGSWYAAAWHLGGDAFLQQHVLKENVFRFLAASKLDSGHQHAFYYYLLTLPAGFLPWTPLVVAALWAAARSPAARREPRIAFPLVWFTLVLLFYSMASSKRSVYLLPLYPAGALLVGWWWDGVAARPKLPGWIGNRVTQGLTATAAVAVLVLLLAVLTESLGLSPLAPVAPLLHPRDRANLPIVMALVDEHLTTVASGLACMLASLAAILWALRRRRAGVLAPASLAFTVVLWLLIFGVFQPALAQRRTFAAFVNAAGQQAGKQPLHFYPGTFDFGAAFYSPSGTRPWPPGRRHGAGADYVLIWDETLADLPGDDRARFEVVATSDTTDHTGRKHLTLVRLR